MLTDTATSKGKDPTLLATPAVTSSGITVQISPVDEGSGIDQVSSAKAQRPAARGLGRCSSVLARVHRCPVPLRVTLLRWSRKIKRATFREGAKTEV